MSDLFHEMVPDLFIERVFGVMASTPRHTYQVLTKRAERMAVWHAKYRTFWRLPNIWLGVSVEDRRYGLPRIPFLRTVRAGVRFLSIEPLLENLEGLDLTDIDWVIVGGESGPGARPMREEWILSIRDQCQTANVPFFFKQWGGLRKKAAGRLLRGRVWDEMPEVARPYDAAPVRDGGAAGGGVRFFV
jgi:protein gp37